MPMVANATNRIQHELKESLGIQISEDWLEACQSSVSDASTQQVLHQVLHADIRQVASSPSSVPVADWTSHQGPIFCQVEEKVPVSLSSEQRLTTVPPPDACFKLFLCTGPTTTPHHTQVAMTLSTIPNLSSLQPGGKIVLQGPLRQRHGVWLLQGGNTLVLGGAVPSLVQHERRIKEREQKRAGVGVDATIRALIGEDTNVLQEEDETYDETDVTIVEANGNANVPALQLPALPLVALPPAEPPAPPPTAVAPRAPMTFAPPTSTQTRAESRANSQAQDARNPYAASRQASTTDPVAVAQSTSSNHPSTSNDNDSLFHTPPRLETPTASSVPTADSVFHQNQATPGSSSSSRNNNNNNNPYASRTVASVRSTPTPAPGPASIPTSTSSNPYHRSSGVPATSTVTAPTLQTSPRRLHTTNGAPSNPYQSITRANTSPTAATATTTTVSSPLELDAIFTILQNLVQNPTSSQLPPGTSWDVRLEQHGGQMDFHIGKTPSKQYEIVVSATFGRPGRYLACKMDPKCMEPLFDQPPAQLRALRRKDPARAQQLVHQGGERIKQRFFQGPKVWKARLYPVLQELPSSPTYPLDDVKRPILLLEPTSSA